MGAPAEGQLGLQFAGAILFLVDEDVPESVARFLHDRGHHVELTRERLGGGSPDRLIVRTASEAHAVVVTCNYRDFKRLTSRRPGTYGYEQSRYASLVTLECPKTMALERMRELVDAIEVEHALCTQRDRPRFRLFIKAAQFTVDR